jgi:hypothetical protein
MSRGVKFQELCALARDIMQFFFFVCAFYEFESPLFYNHCNCEGNVIIIPFAMGTCQCDPLGGALCALTHFKALHFITNHFPSCLFPSIADDIHIISLLFLYHPYNRTFPSRISCYRSFYPTSYDAPPSSLMDLIANPKVKTLEGKGVGCAP